MLQSSTAVSQSQGGGTLQLKYGGGGWLDSLGSEILVGKDILGFFKNIDLDNSQGVANMIHTDS